jgi:hypothetical protein
MFLGVSRAARAVNHHQRSFSKFEIVQFQIYHLIIKKTRDFSEKINIFLTKEYRRQN